MGFNYVHLLPSTYIYNGLETVNAAVAQAALRSYQYTPTDPVKRVVHAADIYAKTGFISGASSGRGCIAQASLVGLLSLGTAPLAASLPAALSGVSFFFSEPFSVCVAIGDMAVFLGVGPRSSACARAAGREPNEDESLLQYGAIGILEHMALKAAESAAQAGNTWTRYAAYGCAFGVAIVLEPLRAPLACLLVTVRLMSACMHAAYYALVGVIVAAVTRGPTTQSMMFDSDAMQTAADIMGVVNPARDANAPQAAYEAMRSARDASLSDAAAATAVFEAYARELNEGINAHPLGSPPSYDPPAYVRTVDAAPLARLDTSFFTTDDNRPSPPPYQHEVNYHRG